MLRYGMNNAALEKKAWGYIARIFAPAVVSFALGIALGLWDDLLSFAVILFASLMTVFTSALGYMLTCGASSAVNFVPVGYKRRTLYFFVCCIVYSFLFAAAFTAVFVAFFVLIALTMGGAGVSGQLSAGQIAVHPSFFLMAAGLVLGNFGMGAMLGYKTSTKAFWLIFALYVLLAAATIISLLFAPAIEGAPADVDIQIDGLAQIFSHLNNPWLFAGTYFGVYALIFIVGVLCVLKKSKPAAL